MSSYYDDYLDQMAGNRHHTVTCDCGAVYDITVNDGIPGFREVETAECEFCGRQLARYFGDCSGSVIDARAVDPVLQRAKKTLPPGWRSVAYRVGAFTKQIGHQPTVRPFTSSDLATRLRSGASPLCDVLIVEVEWAEDFSIDEWISLMSHLHDDDPMLVILFWDSMSDDFFMRAARGDADLAQTLTALVKETYLGR